MAWRRPGDKPLSEPTMVSLLTHICVTRPQWVNVIEIWNDFTIDNIVFLHYMSISFHWELCLHGAYSGNKVGIINSQQEQSSHRIAQLHCPACRTSLIATRFWVVVICPIIKCLTVLEFSFILFDLCLFITIFNFILNYVPIVTFWIFTYHKIWILLIIFCFIWNYWIFYFLTCLEVFWSVVS